VLAHPDLPDPLQPHTRSSTVPLHIHSYWQVPTFLPEPHRREGARTSRHLKTTVASARFSWL
jgi:hypothetical protein